MGKNIMIKLGITTVVGLLLLAFLNWWWCPTVGFTPSFLGTLVIAFGIPGVICSAIDFMDYEIPFASLPVALILLVLIVGGVASWAIWNPMAFRNAIGVVEKTEADALTDLPTEEQIGSISLMDTESAKKLGDRTLGTLTDLVSQYTVGEYYTICINGEVRKIAPLEYAGFFKAMNNDDIPGYIVVNPLTNEAEFIEVEEGITYSPSAYFGKDLTRWVQKNYPNEYRGTYTFQVDDAGIPYWVYTLEETHHAWGCKVPYAAVLVNAIDGDIEKYELDELPEWVDLVFTGETVETLYNRYGAYVKGFWNSIFTQKGVTATTDDYGYVTIGNDVYIYTGVTSVVADESNLGFIMVNSRTGEFNYYPIAGAEEYSAMSAAEGIVQNYGYKASFPSLVLVNEVPTYVMVLKDSNGLVKQYAMVNMKNYTIAVVADTLSTTMREYLKALNNNGSSVDISDMENLAEETVVVKDILYIVEDGETTVYLKTANGKVFKSSFEEYFVLISVGDTVTVVYEKSDDSILTMVEVR